PLVYVLRLYHIYLMLDKIKQFLFTFVRVVWSEGPLTPAGTKVFDGMSNRSRSTCLKTPQYFKEGRLKPFFANNVDIPFARARRLKPFPRKATVRSGKHMHLLRSFNQLRRLKAMKLTKRTLILKEVFVYCLNPP